MVPVQPTCSPARQCWLRAWDRARTERLIPFRNADGSWSCKSYTITVTGAGWSDLACTCAAGRNGRVCKHAAVTAKAIAIGVYPIRPLPAPVPVVTIATGIGTLTYSTSDPLAAAFN